MPRVVSLLVPTAFSNGAQKLGQPVPLSNFVVDEKRGRSHPAQSNVPGRSSLSSGLLPGSSVASCRSVAYCSGVSSFCHSASVWVTSKVNGASALTAALGVTVVHAELNVATAPTMPAAMNRRLVIMLALCQDLV